MEELRSTETLDREILEDARKKAHKILKTSEDSLEARKREWEKKTEAALDAIRKVYAEKIEKTGEEIFARLPLDKRRARSENAETLLLKAMNDFLGGLPREKILSVLEGELAGRLELWLPDLKGDAPEVLVKYGAMTLPEVKAVLKNAGASPLDWEYKEDTLHSAFPSIVIEDGSVKIRASAENAAAALLQEKRAELAAALLGKEVLND